MMRSSTDTSDRGGEECPKCGYVRTSNDLAPDGTCPRCGIIYAKFEERDRSEFNADPSRGQAQVKKSSLRLITGVAAMIVFGIVAATNYFSPVRQPRLTDVSQKSSEDARVILLSTSWCGYCKLARAFLDRNKIEYVELNIETSQEGMRLYKQVNGTGIPIVLIGDTIIRGFSEDLMSHALRRENLL
jgi:glutaredoxin